ncbi:MAG: hypothetical protein NTX45_06095 [Proteobacteria bacterium]|nr:hypothetical protein [Pseudomonadota bacterium]
MAEETKELSVVPPSGGKGQKEPAEAGTASEFSGSHAPASSLYTSTAEQENTVIPAWMPESRAMDGNSV